MESSTKAGSIATRERLSLSPALALGAAPQVSLAPSHRSDRRALNAIAISTLLRLSQCSEPRRERHKRGFESTLRSSRPTWALRNCNEGRRAHLIPMYSFHVTSNAPIAGGVDA